MSKIAFITPWFIPRYGGGETQLRKISNAATNAGYIGTIYTLQFGRTKKKDQLGKVKILRFSSAKNSKTRKQAFRQIKKAVFENHPDCIYMHFGVAKDLPLEEECKIIEEAHSKKIPLVLRITSTGRISEAQKIYSKSNKTLGKVTKFVTLNNEIQKELKKIGIPKSKIFRTNNGVDLTKFNPKGINSKKNQRKKLRFPEKFTFITHARFSHKKNISALIKAWVELCTENKELEKTIQLLIIGDNNKNTENLKTSKKIHELALRSKLKNLILLGSKPHNEINRYLKASDAYLNLSIQEGMSNSTLEAFASGLFCILTDNDTNRLILGKNGVFVNPDSNEDIKNKIQQTLNLSKTQLKRIAQNNEKRSKTMFNDKLILPKYITLFDSLVKK